MMQVKYLSISALTVVLLAVQTHAQHNHPKPPREAIDACATQSLGNHCSFQHQGRSITGQCLTPPNQSQLLCIPGARQNQNEFQQRNELENTRPTRQHSKTQLESELLTYPANTPPITTNYIQSYVSGDTRTIEANGISNHLTGQFPNRGNPNTISPQRYQYTVPAAPDLNDNVTTNALGYNFGIALNGVPFDPGAAEWYQGVRSDLWQYEALSGVIALGLDENHAHVQPTGAYHYHGIPTGYLEIVQLSEGAHSPLIGWAADGFPIYALYGFLDVNNDTHQIIELRSSYQIKSGNRLSNQNEPGGVFDGTFVGDYEFIQGSGDLDVCNGRVTVTPDFPDGTYAYFITRDWPTIPRCFRGTPSRDFRKLN